MITVWCETRNASSPSVKPKSFQTEEFDRPITEQLGLEERSGYQSVKLPAQVESAGAGDTRTCPGGFWMSSERETLWHPWAACSCALPLSMEGWFSSCWGRTYSLSCCWVPLNRVWHHPLDTHLEILICSDEVPSQSFLDSVQSIFNTAESTLCLNFHLLQMAKLKASPVFNKRFYKTGLETSMLDLLYCLVTFSSEFFCSP